MKQQSGEQRSLPIVESLVLRESFNSRFPKRRASARGTTMRK